MDTIRSMIKSKKAHDQSLGEAYFEKTNNPYVAEAMSDNLAHKGDWKGAHAVRQENNMYDRLDPHHAHAHRSIKPQNLWGTELQQDMRSNEMRRQKKHPETQYLTYISSESPFPGTDTNDLLQSEDFLKLLADNGIDDIGKLRCAWDLVSHYNRLYEQYTDPMKERRHEIVENHAGHRNPSTPAGKKENKDEDKE